jgi:uncharacterized delta-60 repeat protein
VIIGGSFSSVQGLIRSCIARLNADGSADSSFDPGTGVEIDDPAMYGRVINSVALQSDGKVLIGGFFNHVSGASRTSLARLHANGSLDTTFNVGISADGGGDPRVNSVAAQPDGKVLVGGEFNSVNGTSRNGIARLNADGSLDASFSVELTNGVLAGVTSLAMQADGKVLLSGLFYVDCEGACYQVFLIRLNADGSRDTGFNSETEFGNDPFFPIVKSVAVQADGKVLLGGSFTTVNGTNRNGIVRFNVNGTLDGTFNPGTGITGGDDPVVHSVAAQPDGKVLIGGRFTLVNGTNRNGIARLNANGSLDDSFNPRPGTNSTVYSVTLQTNARVFLGGDFSEINGVPRTRIGRLNSDGSLDSSFNPGSGINSTVASLAVQPDGKVLIGGHFTTVQELRRSAIARLHANGSADSTFDAALTGDVRFNNGKVVVYSVVMQPDGKVLIGGQFTNVHGVSRNRIARLHPNGSLDSSFDPGTGITGGDYPVVTFVAAQPDGKVLVGGSFTSVNGMNRNGIARLNANGSLDNSFNPETNGVSPVALQSDGKVLVGSSFIDRFLIPDPENPYYVDVYNYRITRLNANGSRDASFEPAAGQAEPQSQSVNEVVAQPDGKILVGGHFTTFKGSSRNGIARLNADGSLDNSFNPGTSGAGTGSIVLQPDGKILVGGDYGIARLNADGSLDGSFNPATGSVFSIALQSDGKVFIGGSFTTVNGVVRPNVARLFGGDGAPTLNIMRSNSLAVLSWPASFGDFQLQGSTNISLSNGWSAVAAPRSTNNGFISVALPATGSRKFFRLTSP